MVVWLKTIIIFVSQRVHLESLITCVQTSFLSLCKNMDHSSVWILNVLYSVE